MKFRRVLLSAGVFALLCGYFCTLGSTLSHARFRRVPRYGYGPNGLIGWTGGYWFHGTYLGYSGWWWVVGPNWFYYPPDSVQPIYVVQVETPPPPATPPATPQGSTSALPPPPDTPKGSLPNPLPSPAAPSSNFTSATSTQAFSYYCDKTKSYYPIIKECDEGWIAVPMTGPNNVTHYAPLYIPVLEPDTSATAEQVRDHPTVVSLELFGKALVYSFNIDHAFTDHISLGFGAAYWDSSIRWQNYRSTDWIFPFYGNYYFTQKAHRGFLTLGVDWIHVSSPGFDNSSFLNNGAAATLGGGYEYRDDSGFLFRISGILIFGRSVDLSPGVNLGLAF